MNRTIEAGAERRKPAASGGTLPWMCCALLFGAVLAYVASHLHVPKRAYLGYPLLGGSGDLAESELRNMVENGHDE